jgi:hypothetical protein
MNSKGKNFISLFLIISLLILPMTLTAKERRGADLIIQKTDDQQVRGELIAIKESSLLLKEHNSGADVHVDVSDISVIMVERKPKTLLYGSLGLLCGMMVGAAVGKATEPNDNDKDLSGAIGSIIGTILGSFIGISWGLSAGENTIILVYEMSPEEIKKELKELRKKARVPDFQ